MRDGSLAGELESEFVKSSDMSSYPAVMDEPLRPRDDL